MILFITILILLFIPFVISLYNLFTAPRLKLPEETTSNSYFVSVLIPARNEENNIVKCLHRVASQTYTNFEIIVIDDNSTDKTFDTISLLKNEIKRLRILKGEPLPVNWLGKNWACHQLSLNAGGNLLLFIDADVELQPNALSAAVYNLKNNRADLLSIFPAQILKTPAEYLIVPMMNWLLLSFLPLKKVFTGKSSSLTAANGQFMLWERNTYSAVGGHKHFASNIVEDMEMARAVKKKGKRVITLLGDKLVRCRMYDSFGQAFKGFTKNFYPGFNVGKYSFIIFLIVVLFLFNAPLFYLNSLNIFLIPLAVIILNRIFISAASRENFLINIILHPLQIILFVLVGFNSVLSSKKKTIEWKGRKV